MRFNTSSRRLASSALAGGDVMAAPQSVKSLRAYYQVPLRSLSTKTLTAALSGESDRAVVIVLASTLEDKLGENLRAKFPKLSDEYEKELRLFGHEGAMGSFSAKIKMAFAFGMIEEKTWSELDCVREMRNACAHSFQPISFETPQLVAVCRRLYFPSIKKPEMTWRSAFLLQCSFLHLVIARGSRAAAMRQLKDHVGKRKKAKPET